MQSQINILGLNQCLAIVSFEIPLVLGSQMSPHVIGQYEDKSFKISLSSFSCLGVIILHFIASTAIHNCSSSGSLFFTTLRQNN